MHLGEFVYRTPVEKWHKLSEELVQLCQQRHASKIRMRQSRQRRAQQARVAARASKDPLQHRLEQVLAGNAEWDAVGCTAHDLRRHIEQQFRYRMAWHNHEEWHLEYIVPRCAYTAEDAHRAFHYTNLRPVWGQFGFATYKKPTTG